MDEYSYSRTRSLHNIQKLNKNPWSLPSYVKSHGRLFHTNLDTTVIILLLRLMKCWRDNYRYVKKIIYYIVSTRVF